MSSSFLMITRGILKPELENNLSSLSHSIEKHWNSLNAFTCYGRSIKILIWSFLLCAENSNNCTEREPWQHQGKINDSFVSTETVMKSTLTLELLTKSCLEISKHEKWTRNWTKWFMKCPYSHFFFRHANDFYILGLLHTTVAWNSNP